MNTIVVTLLLLVFRSNFYTQEYSNASSLVKHFCESEFIGDPKFERPDLIIYSPQRDKMETSVDPDLRGMIVSWDNDQLIIVKSYTIKEIHYAGEGANCSVVYENIGKITYNNRKQIIITGNVQKDTVLLSLIFRNHRWWIQDPPLPRISLEAITTIFENTVNRLKKSFGGHKITETQKKYLIEKENILKVLKLLTSK